MNYFYAVNEKNYQDSLDTTDRKSRLLGHIRVKFSDRAPKDRKDEKENEMLNLGQVSSFYLCSEHDSNNGDFM